MSLSCESGSYTQHGGGILESKIKRQGKNHFFEGYGCIGVRRRQGCGVPLCMRHLGCHSTAGTGMAPTRTQTCARRRTRSSSRMLAYVPTATPTMTLILFFFFLLFTSFSLYINLFNALGLQTKYTFVYSNMYS